MLCDTKFLCRLTGGDHSALPLLLEIHKLGRHLLSRPAEADTAELCGGDSFFLPLTDILTLRLRDIGQDLQHQIRDEGARQILIRAARVEQRHIKNDDIRLFRLRDIAPLIQNLLVIAAQPIDRLDDQRILRLETPQETLVARAVEILAAELIQINVALRYGKLPQRNHLAILALFLCGYAHIAVNRSFHDKYLLKMIFPQWTWGKAVFPLFTEDRIAPCYDCTQTQ